MSAYTVQFERVGRDHYVPSMTATGDEADEIAFAVYQYVRPKLRSGDVEVVVNLEEMRGTIFCGFHVGGKFTLTADRFERDAQTAHNLVTKAMQS